MTGELHCIIVRGAIKALRSAPKDKQIEYLGYDFPNLDLILDWVNSNPTFESEDDKRAMEIIRAAAAKLQPKTT